MNFKNYFFITLKGLILILGVSVFYNCSRLTGNITDSSIDLASMSYKELEANARDTATKKHPLRKKSRGGGSSGGSSGGGSNSGIGSGGQPILKTFCPDCTKLITCLRDATVSTNHLLKGWYYFCPKAADFCLDFFSWAGYQLPENKYREWIKHQRKRENIKAVDDATDTPVSLTSYGRVYFDNINNVNNCYYTGHTAKTNRDTQCDTDHAGDQTAITNCKLASHKTYFVDTYSCWAAEYEHKSNFFCD